MSSIIKDIRTRYKLSQSDIVDLLHLQNRATVSCWETGKRNVSKHMLALLAEKLYLDYDALCDNKIVELTNNDINNRLCADLARCINKLSDADKLTVATFLKQTSNIIIDDIYKRKKANLNNNEL